jgi:hypothetical protein
MFQTNVVVKIKTQFYVQKIFFSKKKRSVYENLEKYGTTDTRMTDTVTDDNITRRMRIACWITKATKTRSEYVILIAFPRQLLRERV